MAQCIRDAATEPAGLSAVPGTCIWKDRANAHRLSSEHHMYAIVHSCVPSHTPISKLLKEKEKRPKTEREPPFI